MSIWTILSGFQGLSEIGFTKEIPAFGLVSFTPRRLVAHRLMDRLQTCLRRTYVFGVVAAVPRSNSGSTAQHYND
jgi:hypothetical protein